MSQSGLTRTELRAAFSLASVFSLRMLGLFMILPVFALYGQHLDGYSPLWVGLAIGAYGLTQALLQIPMGMASDRFGRRKIIILGLLMFSAGSAVAALAHHILWVVVGRALQGAGAIASAVLAMAADLSRDEQRPKVMAIIGVSIGMSFALAMVVGPILAAQWGLSGLFWLTAVLALGGILVVWLAVPKVVSHAPKGDTLPAPQRLGRMLKDPQLIRLDLGIFLLHFLLTATFVVMPSMLVEAGLPSERHWELYFPIVVLAFFGMVPMIIVAEKKHLSRQMIQLALVVMLGSLGAAWYLQHWLWGLVAALVLFFVAFNYLEATLPALIARIAPAGDKGSAMGIYSSSQFLGAFFGGSLAGAMAQYADKEGVLLMSAALVLLWLWMSRGMRHPSHLKSVSLSAPALTGREQELAAGLSALPGVLEVNVMAQESAIYLKVNTQEFELAKARALLAEAG
ncbi:MFS transporter [Gallaecimonas xiamenensis]|uniref:Transporter n=1 Tax=Gallaecimonas xiamenensis 3-C-1 TaxID=745411 RepID=K2IXL5_9GAMM|nr:MFS transporter [Gallaecimonas xiamenensis]EKE67397.1 transporter [Gallaecimonas xiamenensis 3-C-1]